MSSPSPSSPSADYTLSEYNALSIHPYPFPRVDLPPFNNGYALAPRLRIVTFGDSLTQYGAFPDGWQTLLSARYQRRADVFNRGYSGYTVRNALTLLREHVRAGIWPFVPSAAPSLSSTTTAQAGEPVYAQLVTLCFGANDAAFPCDKDPPAFSLHVPLPTFTALLRQIVSTIVPEYAQLTSAPSSYLSRTTALILITPPQLDEPVWREYLARRDNVPPEKSRDVNTTRLYADAVRAIGREWCIPVLDLWELTGKDEDGVYRWFMDGLHFNGRGNARWFEGLVQCIEQHYPTLRAEALGMDAPLYDDGWDFTAEAEQKWPSPR